MIISIFADEKQIYGLLHKKYKAANECRIDNCWVMVYARCLHQVIMWADRGPRVAHPITRGLLSAFLQQACRLQGSELLRTYIGDGYVTLLVDLNVDVSIALFVDRLSAWTSSWISGGCQDYWNSVYYRSVSPEDKGSNILMTPMGYSPTPGGLYTKAMHHIILITSRGRLLIPEKYRGLMARITTECARDLGADVVRCSVMRNHLHLLCGLSSHVGISQFIDMLKANLQRQMLSNQHLRRAEGWSEHSVAYTVSSTRILDEEHTIADQDNIHSCHTLNEMSPLYQRLGIPYVASLH